MGVWVGMHACVCVFFCDLFLEVGVSGSVIATRAFLHKLNDWRSMSYIFKQLLLLTVIKLPRCGFHSTQYLRYGLKCSVSTDVIALFCNDICFQVCHSSPFCAEEDCFWKQWCHCIQCPSGINS